MRAVATCEGRCRKGTNERHNIHYRHGRYAHATDIDDIGVWCMNELTKNEAFELTGVSEEEFNEHYNQLVEEKEWMKQFKDKLLDAVLSGGMMPGDYPVTLKTKYIDFQVIYPKQEPTLILDNDLMKVTDIDVDIVDPITGEVTTKRVNAYEWFKTKQKKPSSPYVKEMK